MHTFIAFTPRTIHTISLTNHWFLFFNRTTSQNSIEVFHQCESWDQWSKLRWGFCVFFYYRYKMCQSQSSEWWWSADHRILPIPTSPNIVNAAESCHEKDQFASAVTYIVLYWKLSHWNMRDENNCISDYEDHWWYTELTGINFET